MDHLSWLTVQFKLMKKRRATPRVVSEPRVKRFSIYRFFCSQNMFENLNNN